jgi:predicted ArsR family transcriptional regulator
MIDPAVTNAALHPTRLGMLVACSEQPATAAQLRDRLSLTDSAARWHLNILHDAHLLTRDGRTYNTRADWRPFAAALEAMAERVCSPPAACA